MKSPGQEMSSGRFGVQSESRPCGAKNPNDTDDGPFSSVPSLPVDVPLFEPEPPMLPVDGIVPPPPPPPPRTKPPPTGSPVGSFAPSFGPPKPVTPGIDTMAYPA